MFFDETLVDYIVEMTNKKLAEYLDTRPGAGTTNKNLVPFSQLEMYAFIGLLILVGVFRASREPLNEIYCEDPNKARPIFKASIPRDRLKSLLRFLRFDDLTSRIERVKLDKLAPIRTVFDNIKSKLFESYLPGTYLTIDEHLCRYRGKYKFRQYLPSKPDKYGIKVWVIADSLNYYPINLEVYLGKHQKQSNKIEDVVLRLAAKLRPGHCLVGDNYFTSLKLCQTLLSDKSIFYYGTIKSIRREIPNVLTQLKGIPQYSSKFLFHRENTLVSYIRKKNSNVLLLSNVHHNTEIVETEEKKTKGDS